MGNMTDKMNIDRQYKAKDNDYNKMIDDMLNEIIINLDYVPNENDKENKLILKTYTIGSEESNADITIINGGNGLRAYFDEKGKVYKSEYTDNIWKKNYMNLKFITPYEKNGEELPRHSLMLANEIIESISKNNCYQSKQNISELGSTVVIPDMPKNETNEVNKNADIVDVISVITQYNTDEFYEKVKSKVENNNIRVSELYKNGKLPYFTIKDSLGNKVAFQIDDGNIEDVEYRKAGDKEKWTTDFKVIPDSLYEIKEEIIAIASSNKLSREDVLEKFNNKIDYLKSGLNIVKMNGNELNDKNYKTLNDITIELDEMVDKLSKINEFVRLQKNINMPIEYQS